MPSEIRVPEDTHDKQAALLATFLKRQAHSYLIPRLERHARTTQLFPASSSLTSQNLLGRVPQNHRHTLQLAAGRRTGIRCRLCLHTRTLPPRPSRPQPRLLGTDPPLRPLHARSETVAQNPRQGTFRLGLTRSRAGPPLSDGIRAGTGTRPPDSNRDDALPPVRGRMAAHTPSAAFHFTPLFRNPKPARSDVRYETLKLTRSLLLICPRKCRLKGFRTAFFCVSQDGGGFVKGGQGGL